MHQKVRAWMDQMRSASSRRSDRRARQGLRESKHSPAISVAWRQVHRRPVLAASCGQDTLSR
ncbi:hypothetical protein [Lysobacter gummosus]|uniref:hypothetical protein n=1 Tax=Lysobacter gummosus TaxID=262324 RepID=UPI00362508F3